MNYKQIIFVALSSVLIVVFISSSLIYSPGGDDGNAGSMVTTIHYVRNAAFSEGLDRAVFGQYNLLMTPLQPFLICYIFKGYSYSAQFKIKSFIDSIQNDRNIWQSLQKFFKMSKSVQLNDVPTLESLITNIFVKKIIQ